MAQKINDGLTPQKRYDAKNLKKMTIAFVTTTEQDILSWLEQQPNKAGYIKNLIREDIKKKGSN